jgi:predicted ABC-type ATPase
VKAYFLFTAGGPLVILTSYDSIENPKVLKRLNSKGISKFIAHEVPVELAKTRYGRHFNVVCQDLHECDDLRVLDYSGERAFNNFSFQDLGGPIYHEQVERAG